MLEHQQLLERKAEQRLAREAKEQGAIKGTSPTLMKKEAGAAGSVPGGAEVKVEVQEEERLPDFLAKAWVRLFLSAQCVSRASRLGCV